jgi:preprotein translocase subunit YajC
MIIFVYVALLIVAFFFLIVRPQRRQMAARRALIASLEVGDEVITAGGIFGTILEISDTDLQVEVADGIVLKFAREAVSARPGPAPTPVEAGDDGIDDADDLRSSDETADPLAMGEGERPAEDT